MSNQSKHGVFTVYSPDKKTSHEIIDKLAKSEGLKKWQVIDKALKLLFCETKSKKELDAIIEAS